MVYTKRCKNLSGYSPVAVPSALARKIEAMPKAEIHVHIEGATDSEVYWQLAKKNNVRFPVETLEEFRNFFVFRDFNHFIEVYITAVSALKTPEDYYFIIDKFMESQAAQNIVWTQAFLSLSMTLHLDSRLFLQALKQALNDGHEKHGVHLALIGDIARQIPESQEKVTQLILDGFKQKTLIGLGLGGIETGFPPKLFVESYDRVRKAGIELFAHAGETTGPETIRDSVDLLGITSVGHGIRVLDDPSLVQRLAKEKVVFEVCPQSNYATGLVHAGEPHPIRKMVDAGLACTVNSDDPAMFSSSLTNEYQLLAAQGFSWDELWQLNLNGLKAASIPKEKRPKIEAAFREDST